MAMITDCGKWVRLNDLIYWHHEASAHEGWQQCFHGVIGDFGDS